MEAPCPSRPLSVPSARAGDGSSYLRLVGLLELHFVQLDLLVVLIPQVLQCLGHFGLVFLLATGVHLNQTVLVSLSCFPYFLRTNTRRG